MSRISSHFDYFDSKISENQKTPDFLTADFIFILMMIQKQIWFQNKCKKLVTFLSKMSWIYWLIKVYISKFNNMKNTKLNWTISMLLFIDILFEFMISLVIKISIVNLSFIIDLRYVKSRLVISTFVISRFLKSRYVKTRFVKSRLIK